MSTARCCCHLSFLFCAAGFVVAADERGERVAAAAAAAAERGAAERGDVEQSRGASAATRFYSRTKFGNETVRHGVVMCAGNLSGFVAGCHSAAATPKVC